MVNKTLPQAFFESAAKHGRKNAISYKKNGVYYHVSYRDLVSDIRKFSSGMLTAGIKPGDRLAIMSKGCPEWAIFDFGTMLAGAITVPIHSTLSLNVISHILNHSEARILAVRGGDLLNKVLLVQDELRFLETIIFIGDLEPDISNLSRIKIVAWSEVINNQSDKSDSLSLPEIKSDDVCSILYTSGTTGLPKGVCLTHNNFLNDIELTRKSVPFYEKDVFLSFLPLSHVLERMGGYYYPLLIGASIAYAEGPKELARNLKEIHPTVLISVPRIFERFYEAIFKKVKSGPKWKERLFFYALRASHDTFIYRFLEILVLKKIRKQLGGRLRLAISGGAPLDARIGKFFSKIGLTIVEGYGLTETSPVVAVNKPWAFKFGTVGHVIDGVEVKISLDKEIWVKGPIVMKGYYNDEKETRVAIDEDGWFHTGDLGFFDGDGFLTIIGRKKEMMVTSGGKNIWPEPIENQLTLSKYISQAVIIAHNKKFVSALIVPAWDEIKEFIVSGGGNFSRPELMAKDSAIEKLISSEVEEANKHLADYEKIKKTVIIPNEFSESKDELTPTLKLRRNTIDSRYHREIESIYS